MKVNDALPVIKALANGVDPTSGEAFPAQSPYQRADVVRALFVAAEALERVIKIDARKGDMPAKAGQPWTEEEDRQLLASFDAGRGVGAIAEAHERTQTCVKARLIKYGRLAA